MDVTTVAIMIAATIALWLLVCLLLYRRFHRAAWLAGSSVASCLFFLGATAITSCMVAGTRYLLPLELAILVLAVAHLRAAQRTTKGEGDLVAGSRTASAEASMAAQQADETLI
jgi:hypothetical protein